MGEKESFFSAEKRCRGKKNQGTERKARSSNPHPTIFSHTPFREIKGDFSSAYNLKVTMLHPFTLTEPKMGWQLKTGASVALSL